MANDIITLRFHPDAPPDFHYNCFTYGSSAGSPGDGENAYPISKDFYVGCMMKNYASRFPDRLKEQILSNDALKRFLESANKRI